MFEAGVPPLRLRLPKRVAGFPLPQDPNRTGSTTLRVTDGNRTRIRSFTDCPRGHTSTVTVGEAGFEPATTSTQSSCTSRLCYSPEKRAPTRIAETHARKRIRFWRAATTETPHQSPNLSSGAGGGGCSPHAAFGAIIGTTSRWFPASKAVENLPRSDEKLRRQGLSKTFALAPATPIEWTLRDSNPPRDH